MRFESVDNFLDRYVSEVKPRNVADTYSNNGNDSVGERQGTKPARNTTKGAGTSANGNFQLGDDFSSTADVVAAIELGKDSVASAAEGVEGGRDIGVGPLLDDFRNSAGEGHDTSSEDGEDGRETHDEEV